MQDSKIVIQIEFNVMSKTRIVPFRLEEEDYALLKTRASMKGFRVSKYLRYLIRNDGLEMPLNHDVEKDLRRYFADTSRLGSNINQIMREVNSNMRHISGSSDDLNHLLHQTKPILMSIKELLAKLVRQTRV